MKASTSFYPTFIVSICRYRGSGRKYLSHLNSARGDANQRKVLPWIDPYEWLMLALVKRAVMRKQVA
eukprot:2192418-Amphidinium_carterae.1